LRGVVSGDVLDVLVGQRCRKAGHDRVLARAAFVVAQRLHHVIGILAAQLRVVGDRAVAVEAMTRLADLLHLGLACGDVGGERRSGGEHERGRDEEGSVATNHHLLAAFVGGVPCE
jgi:hypothetical protein